VARRSFRAKAAVQVLKTNTTMKTKLMKSLNRREFIAASAAVGATLCLPGTLSAAVTGKKTFTILHTNDLHSNLIGPSPASDYSPFTLNDDQTRGGFARLATLIARRKAARKGLGPVLILDAGDYSMGTAFAAAIRETAGELQLMHRMGYDATTFGNHDFDLGPDGTAQSIAVAAKAGRLPAVVAANDLSPGLRHPRPRRSQGERSARGAGLSPRFWQCRAGPAVAGCTRERLFGQRASACGPCAVEQGRVRGRADPILQSIDRIRDRPGRGLHLQPVFRWH
jgi:hypothetical protein